MSAAHSTADAGRTAKKNPLTNWGVSADAYQLIDGLLCTGGGARVLGRLSGFRNEADLDFVMRAVNDAAKIGSAP